MRAGDKRFSSHVLEFMNFVDLVAILPFWAELVLHTHSELGVIRVLRLVRIFRVAKVSRTFPVSREFLSAARCSSP